jgi:hypothetical protein
MSNDQGERQQQSASQTCGGGQEERQRQGQSQMLVDLAGPAKLFHTPNGQNYAAIPVNSHSENWPIESRSFARWLMRKFYEQQTRPPCAQALKDALAQLEAKAQFDGPEKSVHIRVAGSQDAVYWDLGNDHWKAVEITEDGWRVCVPPVRFFRTPGMKALPDPVSGGSLDRFAALLNLPDDNSRILALAWLVGALCPQGPYPILILEGEQGSSKTTTARMLRSIIDPYVAAVRTTPKDERDLMIAANNGWILAFDNLSRLPDYISDGICRLSTGGGFATRQLYTNTDEVILDVTRPVILNGIEHLADRHDLQDRAIILELPCISPSARRPESDLWTEFDLVLPGTLGALCDAVRSALRNRSDFKLEGLPRMADFATWVSAAEDALPWQSGGFLKAYRDNCSEVRKRAIEFNPVAVAVTKLVENTPEWEGTASQLLDALNSGSGSMKTTSALPKAANTLSAALKRVAPLLRVEGTEVEWLPRTAVQKLISIKKVP